MKNDFENYLKSESLEGLSTINKSDLHNHFGKGGRIDYLSSQCKVHIEAPPKKFDSLAHMDEWFKENIKYKCSYMDRLEAAFVQARRDNIQVLAASFGSDKEMPSFIQTMKILNRNHAPKTLLLPELALDRGCDVDLELSKLDEILSYDWFKSIDIIGGESDQPIENFTKIYRKAKEHGLRLKAHVGEFGSADDIMRAIEVLSLDEVHHGIACSNSKGIMKWLSNHKIQLNICPSSNVKLGVVKDYSVHPIRIIYDYGIPVTINSDDILVFNQSVSQEYLNLYQCGLMSAKALNEIRILGLKQTDYYE